MDIVSIVNAFPKKISVTFIHAVTGKRIGIYKMKSGELPLSFDKPITIERDGMKWRVMQANPIFSKDFTSDSKLTLHVQEIHSVDPHKIGSSIPTVCAELPELTNQCVFTDFTLALTKENWRQVELFPTDLLPSIQEEILQVEPVLSPGEGINTLIGYKSVYERKIISYHIASVSFKDFCTRFNITERGSITFPGSGFIQNGFALRNSNYTYYGIYIDDQIEKLCLESFDSIDEELCDLMSIYNLALADWCNAKIILM